MNKNEKTSTLKEERKQAIIMAALKVFSRKGYDGTTVDDIVKKAECSHGLFYHYFKSKKALFDEILKIRRTTNNDKVLTALNQTNDYCEKLRIILNNMFGDLKNDENFAYFFYFFISQCFSFREEEKKIKEEDLPKSPPPIVVFTELFDKGQKDGYFTTKYSPSECARLLISIIQGAMLVYVISPKEFQNKINILPNIEFIIDTFRKENKND